MTKVRLVGGGTLLVLALAIPRAEVQDTTLSFFITSSGSGDGANLGGLAGADKRCQTLAGAVGQGTGKTWRAYLSADAAGAQAAVNAKDRIGRGPWYNAKGVRVAENVADLHSDKNMLGKENSLTEKGAVVNGRGDNPNTHDILTGSQMDGTLQANSTCNNWTSAADGSAQVGHHDKPGWRHQSQLVELGACDRRAAASRRLSALAGPGSFIASPPGKDRTAKREKEPRSRRRAREHGEELRTKMTARRRA